MPPFASESTSSRNRGGYTTTPLPITLVTFGRMTPVGSSESLNALPFTTTVPGVGPPLYRTTMSKPSPSRSTIFPLASSPHCKPTTHVPGIVVNRR